MVQVLRPRASTLAGQSEGMEDAAAVAAGVGAGFAVAGLVALLIICSQAEEEVQERQLWRRNVWSAATK